MTYQPEPHLLRRAKTFHQLARILADELDELKEEESFRSPNPRRWSRIDNLLGQFERSRSTVSFGALRRDRDVVHRMLRELEGFGGALSFGQAGPGQYGFFRPIAIHPDEEARGLV